MYSLLCRNVQCIMTGNSEIVSHHNIIFGLTVDWENYRLWKTTTNSSKVEYIFISYSNTIPTGRCFWQCPVLQECEVSVWPEHVSPIWHKSVKGQYLRRGLRLKSVPTTFRQLAEMPGGRRRTNPQQKSTRVRAVSSGSKLSVFEPTQLACFNHSKC